MFVSKAAVGSRGTTGGEIAQAIAAADIAAVVKECSRSSHAAVGTPAASRAQLIRHLKMSSAATR